jgi:UDP-N-acetylmuramate--alanine ligase
MNIYFSGIGGVGLGALAELAQDAGHQVQGSDVSESLMTKELATRGIAVNMKQKGAFLQAVHGMKPVDYFVYTAALPDDHPELEMARHLGIKTIKRDELLRLIIDEKGLKLLAVTGTHGKTTTTAMLVWAMRQLGVPISYSVGTTLTFGASGQYTPGSQYFIYECDEFDRNFLAFHPFLSIITSIDYDHPDTYGTPEEYIAAFRQFMDQSEHTIMWQNDGVLVHADANDGWILNTDEVADVKQPGHNKRNATLALKALEKLDIPGDHIAAMNSFPGSTRRFELIAPNLYSDYGHHPTEIASTLEMAHELNEHVVLVYQPHQNTRQHQVRSLYADAFELAEVVYWLPTYLTREDPSLPILTPEELTEDITNKDAIHIVGSNDDLWGIIQQARADGKLVLVMGAGSIDSWLRDKIETPQTVNILLVDTEGNFIMKRQPGDNNHVATIGGSVSQDDVSLLAAAARVLRENTNLVFTNGDLAYFRTYPRTVEMHGEKSLITYFTMTGIISRGLTLSDGFSPAPVSPNELSQYAFSILDRSVIVEFTHPAG